MDFGELLKEYTQKPPRQGEIIEAEILQMNQNDILLDVGSKRDAIAPAHELDALAKGRREELSKGDRLPVVITYIPQDGGQLQGSIRKGLEQEDWVKAEKDLNADKLLRLEVMDCNKGGLLVQYGSLQGFVPNSHIYNLRHDASPASVAARKQAQIGKKIALQFIEVDQMDDRLVLSNSQAYQEQRIQRLRELQAGNIVTGTIANLVEYGAFVDLGGVDGLIHRSELSWEYVEDVSEILIEGDEIDVYVKDVDIERERISLSLKALQPSPWDSIDETFQVGDLVEGTVVNVRDFGIFVDIGAGMVGLIHRSEMDQEPYDDPSAYTQKGDRLLSRIIQIDPVRERIGLSQRKVSAQEHLDWVNNRSSKQSGPLPPA